LITPARSAVDPSDPFLYHKTTHRRVYEDAVRSRPGFSDVLLHNTRGEATESAVANVVVELEGTLWTPPIRCGLLPGVFRRELLRRGEVQERSLTLQQVLDSPKVYLVNSVRGARRVRVVRPDRDPEAPEPNVEPDRPPSPLAAAFPQTGEERT
jgi:para-aminobenzoate synthetase/4-amino-4-deoxychorismate lyase